MEDNIGIKLRFNKYIDENLTLRKFFDDLSIEDGIMLQSFFEDFVETVLKQRQEETLIKAGCSIDE